MPMLACLYVRVHVCMYVLGWGFLSVWSWSLARLPPPEFSSRRQLILYALLQWYFKLLSNCGFYYLSNLRAQLKSWRCICYHLNVFNLLMKLQLPTIKSFDPQCHLTNAKVHLKALRFLIKWPLWVVFLKGCLINVPYAWTNFHISENVKSTFNNSRSSIDIVVVFLLFKVLNMVHIKQQS